MKETSKAQRRRCAEDSEGKFDWGEIFKGNGLDVGSGDDPLPNATPFNLPDGGGDDLTDFFPGAHFDYIHGSQVLEHAIDPVAMLRSWIECLKPGGYIVVTVPDWKLYEKETWPSRFNSAHQSTWSLDVKASSAPIHCKLPEWLKQFFPRCRPLLCRLVTTNYDFSLGADVDQTFDSAKGVECFIEFVLQPIPPMPPYDSRKSLSV